MIWSLRRCARFASVALALAAGAMTRSPVAADGDAVEILRPAVGEVVPRTFPVEGRVTGAQGVVITVNGDEVAWKDGAFSTRVAAQKDGAFVVRLLYGVSGQPATIVERQVEVDGTPPKISGLEPKDLVGEFPSSEAHVRGLVEDAHPADVKMNGQSFPVGSDGTFDAAFLLAKEGDLTVDIVATDLAGNSTRATRVLRRGKGAASVVPPASTEASRSIDTLFLFDRSLSVATVGTVDAWSVAERVLREEKLAFDATDRVGVISFDLDAPRIEAPLAPYHSPWKWETAAIRRSTTGRKMAPALEVARAQLRESTAVLRQLIVLLAGPPDDGATLEAAAKALHDVGIGLTLILVGAAGDVSTLTAAARAGGGRFFNPKAEPDLVRTLTGESTILAGFG